MQVLGTITKMKKRIIPILESILLLSLGWFFTYHYNPYLSTPRYLLNHEKLYDTYRIIVDILIWSVLLLRIFRLSKRGFNPIKGKVKKIDVAIFIGYTLLITPDLQLFITWFYFGKMYGIAILLFLSPWLFWFIEFYLSISKLSESKRLKRIGITALGILVIIGTTWAYLYSLKLDIEKKQREKITSEIKTSLPHESFSVLAQYHV